MGILTIGLNLSSGQLLLNSQEEKQGSPSLNGKIMSFNESRKL